MEPEATATTANMKPDDVAATNVKVESTTDTSKLEVEATTAAANLDNLPLACRQRSLLPATKVEPKVAEVEMGAISV